MRLYVVHSEDEADAMVHLSPLERPDRARARQDDRLEFRLLYLFVFFVFLVIAVFTRMLPRHLDPLAPEPGVRRSVIAEARTAASTTAGYAFMG